MTTSHLVPAGALLLALAPGLAFAARAISDLQPPPRRQTIVETAERLAQRPPPPPLPPELPSPFNPPDFAQPETPEPKPGPSPVPVPPTPAVPPAPPADRQVLESLATRIPSTGVIIAPGGRRLLTIKDGKRPLQQGDKIIVDFDGKDYELELVAIDSTTFTLRYRNEEYTRPIRSVR